jgi:hypothetical protein
MKISVRLAREYETKNTWRYKEVDDNNRIIPNPRDAQIGVIYVKKAQIKSTPPDFITATIDIPD